MWVTSYCDGIGRGIGWGRLSGFGAGGIQAGLPEEASVQLGSQV